MPWFEAHALHIFAPPRNPYRSNWVEQILGEVIRPLLAEHGDDISWLWVTRYTGPYSEDDPPLGISIPQEFRANGGYRYIVFRLHAERDPREAIQGATVDLAQGAGCFTDPRGWIPYDPVQDVGGDRFIRDDAERPERIERARLIITFVDTIIRLMLHALSRDESQRWDIEPNMVPKQNPKGSMFESVRHLFFNATAVPTTVLLAGNWTSLQVGTYWMRPRTVEGEGLQNYTHEVQVTY